MAHTEFVGREFYRIYGLAVHIAQAHLQLGSCIDLIVSTAIAKMHHVGETNRLTQLIYRTVELAVEPNALVVSCLRVQSSLVIQLHTLVVRHDAQRGITARIAVLELVIARGVSHGGGSADRDIPTLLVIIALNLHLLSGHRGATAAQQHIAMHGVVRQSGDNLRVAAHKAAIRQSVGLEVFRRGDEQIVRTCGHLRQIDVDALFLVVVAVLKRHRPLLHCPLFGHSLHNLIVLIDFAVVKPFDYAEIKSVGVAAGGHAQHRMVSHLVVCHRHRAFRMNYLIRDVHAKLSPVAFGVLCLCLVAQGLGFDILLLTHKHLRGFVVEARHQITLCATVFFHMPHVVVSGGFGFVWHTGLQFKFAHIKPYTQAIFVTAVEVNEFLVHTQFFSVVAYAFNGHIHHQVVERRRGEHTVAVRLVTKRFNIFDGRSL